MCKLLLGLDVDESFECSFSDAAYNLCAEAAVKKLVKLGYLTRQWG